MNLQKKSQEKGQKFDHNYGDVVIKVEGYWKNWIKLLNNFRFVKQSGKEKNVQDGFGISISIKEAINR